MEICGLALEVFVKLVENTTEMSEVIERVRSCCGLKAMLEAKLVREGNRALVRDMMVILDRLGEFEPEY